jgi:hypothetical protein
MFTGHAIKDMLNNRFYLGRVRYRQEEYAGQHKPIISEGLFAQTQARRSRRGIVRTVTGSKGLLQGMVSCGNCGKGIQSDRHGKGGAMYRERHSVECETNGRSVVASRLDDQIGTILQAVELPSDWRRRMAQLAVIPSDGPDPKRLEEKRRKLWRAYAEDAFTDAEFEERLSVIDRQLSLTTPVEPPSLEEAGQLFENIPELWKKATP